MSFNLISTKTNIARNIQSCLYFIDYLKQEINILNNYIDNIIDSTSIEIFTDTITLPDITLNNEYKYYSNLNNIIFKECNFIKQELIEIINKVLNRLGLCEGEEPSLRSMFTIDDFTFYSNNSDSKENEDNYIKLDEYSQKLLNYIENQLHDKIIINDWCRYELDHEF